MRKDDGDWLVLGAIRQARGCGQRRVPAEVRLTQTCFRMFGQLSPRTPIAKITMDSDNGKLCETCIAALQGKTQIPDREQFYRPKGYSIQLRIEGKHHGSYRDLVLSKEDGCFICSWLWARLQLLPRPGADEEGHPDLSPFRVLAISEERRLTLMLGISQ